MSFSPVFGVSSSTGTFGPRTGWIRLHRGDEAPILQSDTPALLTATSRGVIPHLSQDNVQLTQAIQHIQLQFESFLDRDPPVPTIVAGSHPSRPSHPLHTFLGYSPDRHVVTMTLRDPSDGRRMPPNGNDYVTAHCTRGVRKVNPAAWKMFVHSCDPDLVVALSDTPFTPPPHSQKRLTRSIERSIYWLVDLLRLSAPRPDTAAIISRPRNVLVHLAGGIDTHARSEFSDRLTEPIEQKDAAGLLPFNTLDDGVAGYVFDLLPLHSALAAESPSSQRIQDPSPTDELLLHTAAIAELLRASLKHLPLNKPRIINSPTSPQEILRLVRDIGVDLVDGAWAQRAADIGIALDFRFPVPECPGLPDSRPPRTRDGAKVDLGHNLFDPVYSHDHSRLASAFLDGRSAEQANTTDTSVCECCACSPRSAASRLQHSSVDSGAWQDSQHPSPPSALKPPFVRSYIHHLLHTHEMSSHSMLVMHNLTVFSNFLVGIRMVLSRENGGKDEFAREVDRFLGTYDESMTLWSEAETMWLEVEQARGKGRLSREKQVTSTVGTVVNL